MNNNYYRPGGFMVLPPVVKNLLIVNGLFFLATVVLDSKFHIDLTERLGLYLYKSHEFKPYQLVSHMFMHGGVAHIAMNMFALWMFGSSIENVWGSQRFFVYYFITGLGAALLHSLVLLYQYEHLTAGMDPLVVDEVMTKGHALVQRGMNYSDPSLGGLNVLLNTPTVGASGAVFGVLLAFGMMFPNQYVYLNFIFPIKAKYFVAIIGAIEIGTGFMNRAGDNVAHFAHLGGMLFGYLLIKLWQQQHRRF